MNRIPLLLAPLLLIASLATSQPVLPTPAFCNNLIRNGHFEEGQGSYPGVGLYWETNDAQSHPTIDFLDSTIRHTGTTSQHLAAHSTWDLGMVRQVSNYNTVTPGKTYRASAWIKTANVGNPAGWYVFGIWWFANDARIGDVKMPQQETLNYDWRLISFQAVAPPGANRVAAVLTRHTDGAAWYDDVQIVAVDQDCTPTPTGPTPTLTATPSFSPTPSPTGTPTPVPQTDTDGDGILDAYEGGLFPAGNKSNSYLPDSDGDGLGDGTEDANRDGNLQPGEETSPRNRDTDGDQYEDGIEVLVYGTNPRNPSFPPVPLMDSDSDALPDTLDPADEDIDADDDRYTDGFEATGEGLASVQNPSVKPPLGDANGDGFRDNADSQLILNFFGGFEQAQFLPANSDPNRNAFIDNADSQLTLNYFAAAAPVYPIP